jgi:hypothetical protein
MASLGSQTQGIRWNGDGTTDVSEGTLGMRVEVGEVAESVAVE